MTPGGGGADLAGVSAPKDVSLNIKTSEMMKLKSEKLIQAALIHQKTTFMEFCEKVWDPKLIESSGDDKKFDFSSFPPRFWSLVRRLEDVTASSPSACL